MKKEQRILWLILFIGIFLDVFLFSYLNKETVVRTLEKKEIQMDGFRRMELSDSILDAAALFDRKDALIKVAGGMLLREYDLLDLSFKELTKSLPDSEILEQIDSVVEMAGYLEQILSGIKVFPVEDAREMTLNYENSWKEERSYGGKRFHEGTDLIPAKAEPGQYSVVSMTDGVVEQMGWLNAGGWRVGIRSQDGAYFYYAHLDSYPENLFSGAEVRAGDVIGYMGDSGYGEEGTTGKFPVHLHLGIYLQEENSEISINPYRILKWLEKNTNFKAIVI